MARRGRDDDLLLEDDELAAAFLGDDLDSNAAGAPAAAAPTTDEEWGEEEAAVPGQLAVDVYETKERLVVKARTAGVNKNDLDVSISDNQLTIRGTLSAGKKKLKITSCKSVTGENFREQSPYRYRLKKKRLKLF